MTEMFKISEIKIQSSLFNMSGQGASLTSDFVPSYCPLTALLET